MKMLKRLIDKLLRKEDIPRGDGLIYLRRWTLLRFSKTFFLWKILGIADYRIYLHKFLASDHTKCLHDHPNDLISFIFWNGYEEQYWDAKQRKEITAVYKAPCLRKFLASHTHRVTLLGGNIAWSIVLMYPKKREWGFFITNTGKRLWLHWRDYYEKFGGNGGCD